jgi:hypothetical protein
MSSSGNYAPKDGGHSDIQDKGIQCWSQAATLITGSNEKVPGPQAQLSKASVVTVQFEVIPPNGGGSPFDCTALVTWKVHYVTVRRIVSVGNGVSISGVAEAFSVSLIDTTNLIANVPAGDIGIKYNVTTTAATGTRPTTQQPATLRGLTAAIAGVQSQGQINLAPGANVQYPIPPNAGVISVEVVAVSQATPFAPLQIEVDANGPGIVGTFKSWDLVDFPGFVSVPPNATSIFVTNKDTANSVYVTLTWGIDG